MESDAVLENAEQQNDKPRSGSFGLLAQHPGRSTRVSRPNISALGPVAEALSAAITRALSYVTKVHVAVVEKLSSMNLAATADGPCYSRRYHVAPSHPLAGLSATDRKAAVIHKCRTTATKTTNSVQNALS